MVQGGGTLNINGTQTHGAGVVLTVAGGTANSATDGGANLSLTDPGIVNFSVAQNLAAVTVNSGGVLNVTGGNLAAAGVSANNGTISIASGRTATFNGNISGAGNFTSTGTAAFTAGYSPGNNGTAVISFGGNANLAMGSSLNIELGGTAPGAQFDALHVVGQLTLVGQLNIAFKNGGVYTPASGDSFTLLTWGSRVGMFSNVNLAPLPGGLTWNTSQLYNTGVISIGGLLGDYNQNGVVDAADAVVWRTARPPRPQPRGRRRQRPFHHAGRPGCLAHHFGQVAGGGGSGSSMLPAAVPEPSAVVLLFAAATFSMLAAQKRQTFARRA